MNDDRSTLAFDCLASPGQGIQGPAIDLDRRVHRWHLLLFTWQIENCLADGHKIRLRKPGQFPGCKSMRAGYRSGQVHCIGRGAKKNAHLIRFIVGIHELHGSRRFADTDGQQAFGKRIEGAGMTDFLFPDQASQTGDNAKRSQSAWFVDQENAMLD